MNNVYNPSLAEDGRQARQRLQSLMAVRRQLLLENPSASPQTQLKLLFSIGGWSGSQYFSRVAANRDFVDNFISSAIQLLVKYDFDGLDLDWEFPVTGGASDVESSPKDLETFIALMARLRAALNEASLLRTGQPPKSSNPSNFNNNYLLTIASAGAKYNLDAGYDLVRLAQFVDWFNVMAYDYYGAWDSPYGALTGPVAPLLFGSPRVGGGGTSSNYTQDKCVDYTVKYYVCHLQQTPSATQAGADNSWLLDKIVLGVPFYGRYWNNAGLWPVEGGNDLWRVAEPSAIGGGGGANRTAARIAGGVLSFNEIKAKWILPAAAVANTPGGGALATTGGPIVQKFDEQTRTPFIWNPTTRVLLAYENEQSIWEKTRYVIEHGLGGIMFWSLDLDVGGNDAFGTGQSLLETVVQAGLCTAARGPSSGVPIKYFDCMSKFVYDNKEFLRKKIRMHFVIFR